MKINARWVLPIDGKPLQNHSVVVENGILQKIEPARGPLEEIVLLPGLINAHGHLEFARPPQRGDNNPAVNSRGSRNFTEWVRDLGTSIKAQETIRKNIDSLVRTGTTTIADHVTPDHPLDYLRDSPLRQINFVEVLGAERGHAESCDREAGALRETHSVCHPTPHSFYGTHHELLNRLLKNAPPLKNRSPSRQAPFSIHFLESAEEREWWDSGSGPLADLIRERGGDPVRQREAARQAFERFAERPPEGPPLLFIHANYLEGDEIGVMRRSGASVVHCPGSHHYFGHRQFPLEQLRAAGINIALGTDSLASNRTLSMLQEMRLLKETHPELTAEEILTMATVNGARALGIDHEVGTIRPHKKADLIGIRLPEARLHEVSVDPFQTVLQADRTCLMVRDGKRIF